MQSRLKEYSRVVARQAAKKGIIFESLQYYALECVCDNARVFAMVWACTCESERVSE